MFDESYIPTCRHIVLLPYGKKWYTALELVSRWEDIREIENIMGKRAFRGIFRQTREVWGNYWCRKVPDPCLGFNSGYYKGYDALEEFFKATDDLTALRSKLVQGAHPDKLANLYDEDIFGVGSLVAENITTPVIELAVDGETAKGL